MVLKNTRGFFTLNTKLSYSEKLSKIDCLSTFTTDAGELNVLGHDGDAFGVDRAEIGVFKQTNEVGLRRLLKGRDSRALKAKIGFEVLRNFANKALKGELADEELGRLLVATDFAKCDGTRAVTMGLLDSTSGGCRLAGSLGGEGLAGRLASSGFACSLLSASHNVNLQM